MTLLLDAGGLIALERNDRDAWDWLYVEIASGEPALTHAGVLGQVWRGGSAQALLSKALESVEVLPVNESLGRAAGRLLGRAGRSDVIDAALVALAQDGDAMLTSDVKDMQALANASGVVVDLVQTR